MFWNECYRGCTTFHPLRSQALRQTVFEFPSCFFSIKQDIDLVLSDLKTNICELRPVFSNLSEPGLIELYCCYITSSIAGLLSCIVTINYLKIAIVIMVFRLGKVKVLQAVCPSVRSWGGVSESPRM